MRLDRYLSQATGLSRKDSQRLIKSGSVRVGAAPVKTVNFSIRAQEHQVWLNEQPVTAPTDVYLMLNKPAGYICANRDGHHPTVLDLLDQSAPILTRATLQIAGRLDLDTTGLVLITSDGQWNHRITAPNSGCEKTYRFTLAEPISERAVEQLQGGVQLRSETRPTRPCQITMATPIQGDITLSEGKYHQIKRMFAAVGNKVTTLERWRIGAITLDAALAPGETRPLTDQEINSV